MSVKIADDPDFVAFRVHIGATVRRLRVERGLTQSDLMRRVGVVRNAIHQMEAGEVVSLHLLWRVAGALGVSVGDLLPGPSDQRPARMSPPAIADRLAELAAAVRALPG